jgi:membrane-associated phospholipid phosphatase
VALIGMRDGIVGHWNGEAAPLDPLPIGTGDDDISYLGVETRGNLLDSVLAGAFSSGGAAGVAQVRHRGVPIVTLTRPASAFFRSQLALVRAYADLRSDRLDEIVTQIDDILSFFGLVGLLDTTRRKHTQELLAAVLRLAIHVEMPVKHICRAPRPLDYAAEVQPMLQTPDHSSFPSGHAMEAFAVATVLHRLMTGQGAQSGLVAAAMPFRIAHRIAVNRTVAGLHFPVDSAAGALIGCAIGEAVYREACGRPSTTGDHADLRFLLQAEAGESTPEADFPETADFSRAWLSRRVLPQPGAALGVESILGRFWQKAEAEWPRPGGQP